MPPIPFDRQPVEEYIDSAMKRKNKKKEIPATARMFNGQLKAWQKLYRGVFGVELAIDHIRLPRPKEGFDRLIVVAEGVTLEQVYTACKEYFPIIRHYTNFAEDVTDNDRKSIKAYAVLARKSLESDSELSNISADDLGKKKRKTMTILEHLLQELELFFRTKKHYDSKDITLCAGSRYKDGRVPTTISHNGEFKIHWSGSHEKNPRMRAREIVV